MRIKLLLENIRHHFILSFLIVFVSVVMVSCLSLSFETEEFLYQINKEDYIDFNHNFDIMIKSNTGISSFGTKGEDEELEPLYKRKCTFYNTTLYIENSSNTTTVANIFESTTNNFNSAFNLNIDLAKNKAVVTKELATRLKLTTGDKINIYIGSVPYEYEISSIIDSCGMYAGESIFITGYRVTDHYALRNMYNLILLDVEEDDNISGVYDKIKNRYNFYSVTNLKDQDYIKSLSSTTVDEILIVVSIILVVILLLLINMYTKQLNKQINFFETLGKNNYYKIYQLIAWLFIISISFILSIFIVKWYFDFFIGIYDSKILFKSKIISHIISCIPLILILVFRLLPKLNIQSSHKKINTLINVSILAISILLYLILKNNYSKYVFLALSILFGLILIVELILYLSKYIPSYLNKIYIYDLSKDSKIPKISIIVKIFIIVVTSIVLSTIILYDTQITSLSSVVDFDKAIVTKYKFSSTTSFDKIQLDNNATIFDQNLNILIGVNSSQYDKYLNYGELTDEEKKLFDSNDKYIVLPKYYMSIYKLNIGDEVELLSNEKKETYTVLKFVNHFYAKMAIVNHSDNMYYGYILDDDDINKEIINEFKDYKYSIIDFRSSIAIRQSNYMDILIMLKYSLFVIIIIMILLSIYISYQEQLYQYDNLKKLKLLGCDNKKMFKLTLFKLAYDICISIVLGFVVTSLVLINFDNIVSNFNTIFYIGFDIKVVLYSLIMALMCLIVSFIYTNLSYKKI